MGIYMLNYWSIWINYIVFQLRRLQSTLVVAEHNNEVLSPATQNTLSAAKKIGGDVAVLVAGTKCGPVSFLLRKSYIHLKALKNR